GLAERATMEILKYAFNDLGLHRVYLTVLSDNIAARKLYENCGFDLEGEFQDMIRLGGRYRNQACYAILNWKEKNAERVITV
ncbi:MAG: GNAT family N-acetyltransferase, partial [Lachnospiraceae bacterium]|nr:GNAT family N-acetyltransferase [Lachnospiraceae bacterium]